MREAPPKLPSKAPNKDFRAAWFGGMIEGPRGSDEALGRAVASLNQLHLASVELELDAGQFSVLIDDKPLLEGAWKPDQLEAFVGGLQDLVDAAGVPYQVRSTMRCVELFGDRAVETLFAVIAGKLHCKSQERAPRSSDEELLVRYGASLPLGGGGLVRKLALILGATLLVILMGVQMGLDNLFLPRAVAELEQRAGSFEGLLSLELDQEFGVYLVRLGRGEFYPREDGSSLAGRLDGLSMAQQAATLAVGSGAEIYVRLLDSKGAVLSSSPVDLERLHNSADSILAVQLPTFRRASALELSLKRGTLAP